MNMRKHTKLSIVLILTVTLMACQAASDADAVAEESLEAEGDAIEQPMEIGEPDESPAADMALEDQVSAPVAEYDQPPIADEGRSPASVPIVAGADEPGVLDQPTENRLIWCSEVGRRLPQEQCNDYAEQIADLRSGVAAFNPDRNMVKDRPTEVRLAIGPEEERERIISRAGGEGRAQTAEIEIGARMRARLKGRGFDIDPDEPVDQAMGRNRRQVWNWDVTPRRAGSHQLSAEITVLAEDGTVLDNQSSEVIDVTVVVSESERAALEREKIRKKRQNLEEDVGWATGFLKILDDFSVALLALLTTIIVGGITLFVRAKKAKNGDAQVGND
ncbi:hypothetical protein [Parasphingorhabdus sp.]|uniref:hypothetical protein n=1 Tax=Parasphingorhabdus sp. TaxID=2709688 RepID=UPI00326671CB